jgi:SNW domain-containing protein 1
MNAQIQQSLSLGRPAPLPADPVTTVQYHGSSDHAVRIAEKRVDLLDPSHFRNRKSIPLQQPDPAPILCAPMVKPSAEDEEYWKVPTCISKWKNPEGYVIPMDKRVGADARRFDQPQLSDKFANLSRALGAASAAITESTAQKNLVRRQLAQKAQEEEESRIRDEARRLNIEKQSLNRHKTPEERRIDRVLEETREKRERMKRQNRDVSDQVALGIPITAQTVDDEFDPQLFGKSAGIVPGYGADENHNVYDKPLYTERKEYVPFADDRARFEDRIAPGAKSVNLRFERGERQTPDTRAGVYYPHD